MKKSITVIVILLVMPIIGVAQNASLEDIKYALSIARNDTSRVNAFNGYSNYYTFRRPDSTMFYGAKALTLARQIHYPKGEMRGLLNMALTQNALGNQSKALQIVLVGIKVAEKNNLLQEKAQLLLLQGVIYNQTKNYEKALTFCKEAQNLFDSLHDITFTILSQANIGETFIGLNQLDSALYYCQSAYDKVYDNQLKDEWIKCASAYPLGKVQEKIGHIDLALSLYRQSIPLSGELSPVFTANLGIAQLYQKAGNLDSCIYYGEKSLFIAQQSKFISNIIDANLFLSGIYEKRDTQKALQYSQTAIAYKDSLYNLANKTAQETFLGFDEQERQQEIEAAHSDFQNRLRMNAFSGISFTLLVIAIFLFWNSRLKQKAKRTIEKAYDQLKATQSQLIQAEKMASLGELTAGIAHEIQNPLNFVNNFSEISHELIDEMNEELNKGAINEAKLIASDIKQNLEKILHHGQRADGIVKGMLQHSRSSSGIKELVELNKLVDDYLHLAFHGWRAKDKSFNATMKTDFDPSFGTISVIPQDIGRVVLNLVNNAFYAVTEKKKQLNEYEPMVMVGIKKVGDKVMISVKDNGLGISQKVVDKIFQPFFTTKPTGLGTGLGLSMSYDIIKAHGGELNVNTKEGEGSEFIVVLPV